MEIVIFETLQGPFEDCQYSINAKSNLTTSEASDCAFNPVAWWGLNVKKFPLLAKIAKKIFVIPASSAESERHFSTAGTHAKIVQTCQLQQWNHLCL
jgi:hAT family C-terminal dimerisation region